MLAYRDAKTMAKAMREALADRDLTIVQVPAFSA